MSETKESKPKIYRVDSVEVEPSVRLVRALSKRGAIRHATRTVSASVASQEDLITLTTAGVKVETASAGDEDEGDEEPSRGRQTDASGRLAG